MLIRDLRYLEEQFKNNDIASMNSKELNVFWMAFIQNLELNNEALEEKL